VPGAAGLPVFEAVTGFDGKAGQGPVEPARQPPGRSAGHPPILSDRGLPGAVRALAAGSGLDVSVLADDVDEGPRAPAAVEAAAYFVVAEALTNTARHSGAGRAEIQITRTATGLRVTIRDDGKHGAKALDSLTAREREVLQLMAEGQDNAAIAATLVITERAVSKHIGNVFLKLGLPPADAGHRRVLAVLAYLESR